MKKWIAIVVAAALAIYLSLPFLMNLLGIYTTQAMIFNGNNAVVSCRYNWQEIDFVLPYPQEMRRSLIFSPHNLL